jgi:hypothetical protein
MLLLVELKINTVLKFLFSRGVQKYKKLINNEKSLSLIRYDTA